MQRLLQNVRVGFRSLRVAPGFAITAILTLALGIGLATAVFTVAETLLLRQLPVRDQDRVVTLWGELPDRGLANYPLALGDAREYARGVRTLERVAFFGYEGAAPTLVREGDRLTRLQRALVSGTFFEVLDVRPALGRPLEAADDVRGAAPVIVLSHATWQQRFGGDARVLGRQVQLHEDGVSYTIVGVMPQGLDYPRGTDFWAPLIPARPASAEQYVALDLIGRLAPGATVTEARAELSGFFARTGAAPWQREARGVVQPLARVVLGDTRPAVLAFSAASGLLLLITCINVANLLLMRGLGRVREVAVRAALGAGRRRIVAQLVTEHALLAVAGGVLGVAVAAAAVRGFVAFAPPGLPRLDEIRLDGTVLAGAFGITAVAMLLFALAPAILTSRTELQNVLRSGTRHSASRGARLVREGLVAGQIALALLVLSAAALVGRSLLRLERAELAFDASGLLIAELALRSDQFANAAQQAALVERLLPALRALPGVRGVSPVVAVPFSGTHGWDGRPAADGQTPEEAATNPMLNMEIVAPDYFATLGVPVLRGRGLADSDRQGAPSVVVLSESAARAYWPGQDPVGKRLRMGPPTAPALTVIGIVADTRYRDLREARPSIYFPLAQSFFPFAPTTLAIGTSGRPADLVPAVRRVIGETAPGVAVASAAPFAALLDAPLAQPRLNALLLAVFAGAALVLSAVGLFGVMATMVRQRARELGVRMALGASAVDVRRLVLRRGLALAAVGTAIGLSGALVANRLLAAMLFEVSPTDVPTLAAVVVALIGMAALASFIPARASARIEPSIALRAE